MCNCKENTLIKREWKYDMQQPEKSTLQLEGNMNKQLHVDPSSLFITGDFIGVTLIDA